MTGKKHTNLTNTLIKASQKNTASKTFNSQSLNIDFKSNSKSKKTLPTNNLSSSNISGPIQFIYEDQSVSTSIEHSDERQEFRNYACKNYDCCLNIVAALDWEGFSCQGCTGEVNQTLLWRAQGECSKDDSLKVICELPDLKHLKIESTKQNESNYKGLMLVVNNTAKKI